ncbi:ECF transporter S component [Isachenkonia alkalipeptolytica]|uniref:ECF transporter S component n=2 Tax=Isachenkonia alkalipeptolytica TaxID=2565777 RepID=A0AA44BF64_9CLOT|nr:ECF transporter S component [Isachenkonia alkalipeptolytica]
MSTDSRLHSMGGFTRKQALGTKGLTLAGMLGALSIVLSMTPIGFIPLPTGINATTMHIPTIMAAILGGPITGTLVGLIFGVSSFLRANNPFFANPIIAILPRLLIGVVSYYSYVGIKVTLIEKFKMNSAKGKSAAIVGASVLGTATNTVGVLSLVYAFGYLPLSVVLTVAATNGIAEMIASGVIVLAVLKSLEKSRLFK